MNDFWYLSKDKAKNFKWSKLSFDSSDKTASSKQNFFLKSRTCGQMSTSNGDFQGIGVHGGGEEFDREGHSSGCFEFEKFEVV